MGDRTEISVGSLNSIMYNIAVCPETLCLKSMALYGLLKITNQLCFLFQWCGLFKTSHLPEALGEERRFFCFLFFFTDGRDLRIFISEKASSKVDAEDTGIEEIIVGTRF